MWLSELVSEYPQDALKFTVARQNVRGKNRTLSKPSEELKDLHRRFKARLEETVGTSPLSPIGNLLAHHHNRFVYQFDIRNAFPSVSAIKLGARLYAIDSSLGEPRHVIKFVQDYCMTPKHGLAQGAPASSLLFELLAEFWLDTPILNLLEQLERREFPPIRYTRYVDDLTFSSRENIGAHVRYKLREIVRTAGFAINDRKTTYTDKSQKPVDITGGRLRYKKSAVLRSKMYRELERQLDQVLRHGLTDHGLRSLNGRIAWFESLEKRVRGSDRNRDIRRIKGKADAVGVIIRQRKLDAKHRRIIRFPKEWLAGLREHADIVRYVRKLLPYQWAPKALGIKCPCPFCGSGRRTTHGMRGQTFTVSPVRRSFHCHNPSCQVHGDVIQFAMMFFGWSFATAVIEIAKDTGYPLPVVSTPPIVTPERITPTQLKLL